MQNESLNFSQQQQQNNDSFIKAFFTSATEHSKRLTIIDTIVYVALMTALLVLLVMRPELETSLTEIVSYITTAYVALRATYGLKAGLENYSKIRSSFNNIRENADIFDEDVG